MTSGIDAEDNKGMQSRSSLSILCFLRPSAAAPEENLEVTNPVFYGGALKDFVALNAVNKAGTVEKCKNATIHEYDGGHWVMWEAKDEVNKDLLNWLKTL